MKLKTTIIFCALAAILGASYSCTSVCDSEKNSNLPIIKERDFRRGTSKKSVRLYTIHNADLTMQVTNFGARVISLFTPDRDGNFDDVIVGYGTAERFIHNTGERFFGATVGRVANRIAGGRFTLDGKTYNLPVNNNGQTLHGGLRGTDMIMWKLKELTDTSVVLTCRLRNGQDGFPGKLKITVTYTLTSDNSLDIAYSATTGKATPVNLSNHAYFNLRGSRGGTITDHIMMINAGYITPIDTVLIPKGTIMNVSGTPFDFTVPKRIGRDIFDSNLQLAFAMGYDHNWVLSRVDDGKMRTACIVYEPDSGRKMEVSTDQPGLQFYSGNFFRGEYCGKNPDVKIGFRDALVLETQKWPDAVNHEGFPNTILRKGEVYTHHSIYHFSAE